MDTSPDHTYKDLEEGIHNDAFQTENSDVSYRRSMPGAPKEYKRLVNHRVSEVSPDEVFEATPFSPNEPRLSMATTYSRSLSQRFDIPQENDKYVVVVLGSGDFGRALTIRLVNAGYHVIIASRNPAKASERLAKTGGKIMSQSEALSKSPIVFIAVPSHHHSTLPIPALQNKILIDVSNRAPEDMKSPRSNAEGLQNLIPSSVVVKGFNNLSAYALERNLHIGREVSICCDSEWPKEIVSSIASRLGLIPISGGSLEKSRDLEKSGLQFFPEWRTGFIVAMIIFWIVWILMFLRNMICPNIEKSHTGKWDWSGFSSVMLCTDTLGATAIIILSLVYLPGVLAAYLQLYRKTKYSEFPKWLNNWLLSRKYLGLFVLFFALMHVLGKALDFSILYSYSYKANVEYSSSFNWQKPTYLWFGLMTIAILIVLGITSLPSVSKSLNWREFTIIQSKFGWICLLFATWHVITASWYGILKMSLSCGFIPKASQIAIVFPLITIVLKIPLLLPCVDKRLTLIRRGFDFTTK